MQPFDHKSRSISDVEKARRAEQSANDNRRNELLSRNDIQREYLSPTKRWLELAAEVAWAGSFARLQ